ncbi:alpha,alpha-trehalase TreF [Pseudomonas oligotrophica]|uniref:alpha,alpha-trehalase TreF n=1 Tax=Pseudomonas oligotrophica TaxID=2912055 RepID=UPI001F00D304|nr:alpha,alpha-trehalase TreF [Pseudomonas oligotrophica]MCF7201061.1 alpha,alpha-trehalase TreF [Pseudomonas oligotrophica]
MSEVDPCHAFVHDLSRVSVADTLSPAERYQELFVAVQMHKVFDDSKTFVDCAPLRHPEEILEDYRRRVDTPGFDLARFVAEHFSHYELPRQAFVANPDDSLARHIDRLWPVLTRHPREHPPYSSLLPLPFDYVVPGGRFTELYYWDSYFTMLGLDESGHCELLRAMADNFAYLIDTYGHIPNGNRTYYLGRSQPPVFALMTDLFEETGVHRASDYLPQLRKEHAFWMSGGDGLQPGEAHRRCVRLVDGSLLNRYWDERDTPREEAYREDVETARHAGRPAYEVYRDLRAGAESGWDFSSRWLDDPHRLSSIRTTSILPVDLNSFLYKLELQIARLSEVRGLRGCAETFADKARARRQAMDRHLWNPALGAYFDYDWARRQPRDNLTAATLVPLFVGLADAAQAEGVAALARSRLLAPGGLRTTEVYGSGEQWDCPNGWAPLQWMAIRGLQHYGHDGLALEIERRWLAIVSYLFEREGRLLEKYVLRPCTEHAGGGEYRLQDGFGWTNGVTRKLMQEDPSHRANRCHMGKPGC